MYKLLILSELTYWGVVCWLAQAKELVKLPKTQNRAVRICYKATWYTSNHTLHNNAKLHPLRLCCRLEILKLMYRRVKGPKTPSQIGIDHKLGTRSHSLPSFPDRTRLGS